MQSCPCHQGIIEHYRQYLPIDDSQQIISLGEGNTPLIELRHLSQKYLPGVHVFVKFEGLNPTCSFKDRGMTMAITHAYNKGAKAVICASTGNTSAAAAAYSARAGMRCFVIIPDGKIAMGKLAQAMMYGAITLQIRGSFDDAMERVKQVAEQIPISIVNSINPYRLQGQKTAAFEIIEQLGGAPDYHYLPVGNAGNISAHWMGYQEYFDAKRASSKPIMVGYQACGSAPFVRGEVVKKPETVATAIRIGNPQSWELANQALQQSNGHIDELNDEDILEAQYLLASMDGVFCEPASAASIGGAMKDFRLGKIPTGSSVVCTLTGNGLKDADIAIRTAQEKAQVSLVENNLEAVIHTMQQHL